jgi:multicomponent Na+:H+ antiporter subunit B
MRRYGRLILFAAAMLGILPCMFGLFAHMPRFGEHPLPYGDAINLNAVKQRHVTNMVTAVNFDYRGLDTLGEEIMLVAATAGAVMLLRGSRGENLTARPGQAPGRPIASRSTGQVLIAWLMAPLTFLFGLNIVIHPQLTPGGGFQGGVIVASATLLIWLGEGYRPWRRLMRSRPIEVAEAAGALIYALCGFGPMVVGAAFLQNVLPLGKTEALISGGLILLINAGVGLAVACGFALLFIEFLEETRVEEEPGPEEHQA